MALLAALTTAAIISIPSAEAHEVETAGDVGATMHIEPNDTPKAGEEVLAWFAIARPGGETIPLADCDCTLAIYAQPSDRPREGKTPDLTPTFAAIEAEGYQEIPGARFTFPDVGTYTLIVSGQPKQADSFTPFELDFETTVASGTPIPQIPEDAEAALPAPNSPEANRRAVATPPAEVAVERWTIIGVGTAALVALGAVLFRRPK